MNQRFKMLDSDLHLYSGDGIHPTVKGHKIIAEEWLAVMKDIIYEG